MPPRYAYWTILIDNKPTAFRAREQEELLPTLHQLRRTNKDVVLKWFARGRLWDTPEAAQAASRADGSGAREARSRLAPGRRAQRSARSIQEGWETAGQGSGRTREVAERGADRIAARSRPASRCTPPPGSQPWRDTTPRRAARRFPAVARQTRGAAPPGSQPWRDKPRGAPPAGSQPWRDKPRGAPPGAQPRRDNPQAESRGPSRGATSPRRPARRFPAMARQTARRAPGCPAVARQTRRAAVTRRPALARSPEDHSVRRGTLTPSDASSG